MSTNVCVVACLAFVVGAALTETRAFAPLHGTEGKPDDPRTLNGCTVLRWSRTSWTFPYLPIREAGKYCLDRDYTADLRGCSHGCRGQFIDVRADNVEIDLRGHALTWNRSSYSGITVVGSNITIRNGRLRGPGEGVSLRANSIHAPPDPTSPAPYDIGFERRSAYPTPVYTVGGARIENMVIEAGTPIAAAGANVAITGNTVRAAFSAHDFDKYKYDPDIVRRPFLETARTTPSAMISVYGPEAVIEGNTIEQNNRTGGTVPVYSILLRDAKNSRVRNNIIRNVSSRDRTIAVGLMDSPDVVIEGNTLANIETRAAAFGTKQ